MQHPLATLLVTTPSFGRFSPEPAAAAEAHGIALVRPEGRHPLTSEQLAAEIERLRPDAVLVGLDDVSGPVLNVLDEVRVVAKHGVGTDNIDVAGVERSGAVVINAPGSNSDAVADLAVCLMLMGTRQVVAADASLRRGEWTTFSGRELSGCTVGIIGFGRIGRAVAQRIQAFGSRVVAYDPYLPDDAFTDAGVERAALEDLLAASDVVTLHMPGVDGEPLLDRDALALLPHGAVLVNAARGGLVDEAEVAHMLQDGRLAAAAFDAFEQEPPTDSPLLSAPNVILTPHIGAYTDRANAAMGVAVVDDIARVLAGDAPNGRVLAPTAD
ncbi:phosphoglycerate dehydrogenase [Curtobacterium sp. VKM Ac-1376]|uniref:phosphoglycerate dehydrogenase n=1 Tax=Curtobacterium sp. VKM Ac-1376 TaxID=123312 RepID=UPI00188CECD1|nr:phosphoglycerate dehydrogenase [Curtobacterium sp. VKM Ac-1376]MBF4616374.1 phosphoglycerate dehydrogenase [Curtobacterium sp. VKM Ac-1376]